MPHCPANSIADTCGSIAASACGRPREHPAASGAAATNAAIATRASEPGFGWKQRTIKLYSVRAINSVTCRKFAKPAARLHSLLQPAPYTGTFALAACDFTRGFARERG